MEAGVSCREGWRSRWPVVDVAVAHFNRYHAMREELDRPPVARRTQGRRSRQGPADGAEGFGEEAAYRLMRKLAMDQNKRIGEVAQDIVRKALKP